MTTIASYELKKKKSLIEIFPIEIACFIFHLFDFHSLIKIRSVCTEWNEWIKKELESKEFCKNIGLPLEIVGFQNILNYFSSQHKKMNFKIPKMYEIIVKKTRDDIGLEANLNSNFITFSILSIVGDYETFIIYPSKGHLVKMQLDGTSGSCLYNERGDLFLFLRAEQEKYWELHRFSFYEKKIHKKIILSIPTTTNFITSYLLDDAIFWIERHNANYKYKGDLYSVEQDEWKGEENPIIKTHSVGEFGGVNVISNNIYLYDYSKSLLSHYLYKSKKIVLQKQYVVNDLRNFNKIQEINGKIYLYTFHATLIIDIMKFYCLDDERYFQKLRCETRDEPFDSRFDIYLQNYSFGYYCKSEMFESDYKIFQNDLNGFKLYDRGYGLSIFETKQPQPLPKLLKDTISCKQDNSDFLQQKLQPISDDYSKLYYFNKDSNDDIVDDNGYRAFEINHFNNYSDEKIKVVNTIQYYPCEYDDSLYLPEKDQRFIQDKKSKKMILLPTNRDPNISPFEYWLHGFITYEECTKEKDGKIRVYDYFS